MQQLENIIARLSELIVNVEDGAKNQFDLGDLTATQMHYLEAIARSGNPNMTELSEKTGLTKPTIKVAIDKLIEKDVVYKVRSDSDRRTTHLHLTDKGELLNQRHDFAHRQLALLFKKSLSDSELEQLTVLLSKILNTPFSK